jgi:hypothetical protein
VAKAAAIRRGGSVVSAWLGAALRAAGLAVAAVARRVRWRLEDTRLTRADLTLGAIGIAAAVGASIFAIWLAQTLAQR